MCERMHTCTFPATIKTSGFNNICYVVFIFYIVICLGACIYGRFPNLLKPAASIAYVMLCCISLHRKMYPRMDACALPETIKTSGFNSICYVVLIFSRHSMYVRIHTFTFPETIKTSGFNSIYYVVIIFCIAICVGACIHGHFPNPLKPAASIAYVMLCCIYLHRKIYPRMDACALPDTIKTSCFNSRCYVVFIFSRHTMCERMHTCTFPETIKTSGFNSICYIVLYLFASQ